MTHDFSTWTTSILYHGVTAAFPSEENLKAMLTELKKRMPKDEYNAMLRIIPVSTPKKNIVKASELVGRSFMDVKLGKLTVVEYVKTQDGFECKDERGVTHLIDDNIVVHLLCEFNRNYIIQ
jgi:hypothetical protein